MGNRGRLLAQMLVKGMAGCGIPGIILFVCAGSLEYAAAWRFLAIFAALLLTMGLFLLMKQPETLARRLRSKETEKPQKLVMLLSVLVFAACFVLAGLDWRFGWSNMPLGGEIAALAVFAGGYALFTAVLLQNAYASRTVEVQASQKVIDTGLYAAVRHPMYLAAAVLFLAMPLSLGSYIAFLPMLTVPAVLALRIRNEEAVLLAGLPGYAAYTKKTKYRLIPFIW